MDDASKRLRVDVSADREEYRPRQPVTVSVAVAARDGTARAPSEVTLWAMDYGLLSLTDYTTPDVLKAIYVPKALQVMTEDNRAAADEPAADGRRRSAASAGGSGRRRLSWRVVGAASPMLRCRHA